jgi:hypothetical protein
MVSFLLCLIGVNRASSKLCPAHLMHVETAVSAVHREWMTNVSQHIGIESSKLEKTGPDMGRSVRDCLVTGHEPLIPALN